MNLHTPCTGTLSVSNQLESEAGRESEAGKGSG